MKRDFSIFVRELKGFGESGEQMIKQRFGVLKKKITQDEKTSNGKYIQREEILNEMFGEMFRKGKFRNQILPQVKKLYLERDFT